MLERISFVVVEDVVHIAITAGNGVPARSLGCSNRIGPLLGSENASSDELAQSDVDIVLPAGPVPSE